MDIKLIDPEINIKLNANLYFWLTQRSQNDCVNVYRDRSNKMWIGQIDDTFHDGPWFYGCRLLSVLCEGVMASPQSYHVPVHFGFLSEFDNFWSLYLMKGLCAIDPGHELPYIDDGTRWTKINNKKQCNWCGESVF